MTTLEQLRRRYDRPCITLAEVMADWFPHITSEKHMRRAIREGRIQLRINKHDTTRKAAYFVYLRDLATWLDSRDPSNTQPTADQAA